MAVSAKCVHRFEAVEYRIAQGAAKLVTTPP